MFQAPNARTTGVPSSYTTTIGPLVSVGSQLQQGPRRTLFTVRAAQPAYWRLTALDHYSGAGGGAWTLNAQRQRRRPRACRVPSPTGRCASSTTSVPWANGGCRRRSTRSR